MGHFPKERKMSICEDDDKKIFSVEYFTKEYRTNYTTHNYQNR